MNAHDAANLLAFLQRVSVTGPAEAGELVRLCQLLAQLAQAQPAVNGMAAQEALAS